MKFTDRENNGFIEIYEYVENNPDKVYVLDYGDDQFIVHLTGTGLSSNDIDKDNYAYEEFHSLVFEQVNGEEFVLCYHNLPEVMVSNEGIIFDKKEFNLKKYNQLFDTPIVQLVIGFNGPILNTDIETGDFHTGIDIIDNDLDVRLLNIEASKINRKIRDLNILNILDEDETDEVRVTTRKHLIETIDKLKKRLDEINDGSFIVSDSYNFNYKKDIKDINYDGEFKFTQKDWDAIENKDSNYLLGIGANYYTKGNYKQAFPYYLIASTMGNDQAISNLGYCFMYARSVDKNDDLATALFKLSADMENEYSCYKMATIYKYSDNYKNDLNAKKYFIKAFAASYDNYYYDQNPSLCLNMAREKINGDLFPKDLYGAYFLLKLAYRGYEVDLKGDFKPHEKQFLATKEFLNNSIFDNVKKHYIEGDEDSYIFNSEPVNIKKYHNHILRKGDMVVNIVHETNDNNELPIGTLLEIVELHRDYLLVKVIDDNLFKDINKVYPFTIDKIKKINVNLN